MITAGRSTVADWYLADLADAGSRAAAFRDSHALGAELADATLEHDLAWLMAAADGGQRTVKAYFCRDGSTLLGYAPCFHHPSALTYQLGEVALHEHRIQRLTMAGGPLLVDAARVDGTASALVMKLFDAIRDTLGPEQIVFALGVPGESLLGRALAEDRELRRRFHVLPHGPLYERRRIVMPADYEAYVRQLGSKTREDLRRNERKLFGRSEAPTSVRRYLAPEDVAAFLDAAETVSRRTYQWQLLGQGLRSRALVEQRLRLAADQKWLRCYVLFCGDTPVAFMVGYLHRGTYYSADIGYDPEWARWSVGNVLHCSVMRDLFEVGGVQVFDFLYGDNSNKARLSNSARPERSYYLVPRTARGRLLVSTLALTDGLSASLSRLLERFHVKARLRRLIRRAAVRN